MIRLDRTVTHKTVLHADQDADDVAYWLTKSPDERMAASKSCGNWPTPFTCLTTMNANQLNPDYKEFIELLNAHQVEYLVVGVRNY